MTLDTAWVEIYFGTEIIPASDKALKLAGKHRGEKAALTLSRAHEQLLSGGLFASFPSSIH
jgi:hypothetical protein